VGDLIFGTGRATYKKLSDRQHTPKQPRRSTNVDWSILRTVYSRSECRNQRSTFQRRLMPTPKNVLQGAADRADLL
jgi:hypothetical protein